MLVLVFLLAVTSLFLAACATRTDSGAVTGGDLVIAELSDAVSMDPHGSNDVPSSRINYLVYECLLLLDENSELQPLLATEWYAVDDVTWEFVLRQGVKFTDGTDFNAHAVKATFERLLDPDVASPRLFLFSMIDEIIVVDEHKVQFVTEFPFAPLPAHIAHSGGSIISLAAIEKDYAEMAAGNEPGTFLGENPVGTGVFKLDEWRPGDQIRLVRNEDYWGEKAKLNSVTVKVVPEDLTRLSELETGYAHIANQVQPSDMGRVDAMADADLYRVNQTVLAYLAYNCQKAPFDDIRVRQALNMAVDRDEIIKGAYMGTAVPAHGPFAPGVFGYDPSIKAFPYDLEKAKQLLADAGYADGFSTTLWTNDNPVRVMIAEYVQSVWRDLNIDVEIQVLEWGAYLDQTAAGEHDMFILGWSTPTLDADYATYALFHSDNQGSPGNRSFYSNPKVDDLLDRGRMEADPNERLAIYSELQQKLIEEAPMNFLVYNEQMAGVSKKVNNFALTPASMYALRDTYIVE